MKKHTLYILTVILSLFLIACGEKKESTVITGAGEYAYSGNYNETILIDAGKDDEVCIVLDGATITGTDGPAIYAKKCGKLTIRLNEGTENYLEDSKEYADTSEDAPTGCLFCQDDLTIEGKGTLNVSANHNDGIVSKDNLVISEGTIFINAADDAIVGRDSLKILGGDITINSTGHAIKTTNEDTDKGNCEIFGGVLKIVSGRDGFNVLNTLTIQDCEITVSAEDDGIHSDKELIINSGKVDIENSNEGLEAVLITINGGDINIASKDDGINANGGNNFFGGKNFRGRFGNFSANGEADTSSESNADLNETPALYINGGNIYVNSAGDGLDSNGFIEMNGGFVLVSGPSDNGNNATDYQDTFVMNAGTIIASGSSGMYQSISEDSKCFAIDYITNSTIAAGTKASLLDGEEVLISFTVDKKANAILIAGESLENGKGYSLVIGEQTETVTAGPGSSSGFGGFGGFEGNMPPEGFEGNEPPEGFDGNMPFGGRGDFDRGDNEKRDQKTR